MLVLLTSSGNCLHAALSVARLAMGSRAQGSRGAVLLAAMDTEEPETPVGEARTQDRGREEGGEEPSSYILENPTRVVPAQEQYIAFTADERWEPLRRHPRPAGILLLKDRRPGECMGCLGKGGVTESF